ncbi:MAG: GNAT family N-acetyltransferase, partial [Actinomycetota bacterium]
MTVDVRPFTDHDKEWAYSLLFPRGGPSRIASKQVLYDPLTLSGFVAWKDGERIGLATYRLEENECELLTLDSVFDGTGSGTALIEAVKDAARSAGSRSVWLITTND